MRADRQGGGTGAPAAMPRTGRAPTPICRAMLAVALAACLAAPCAGRTLAVCMGDRDFPPLFFLDHEGQAQWLVRKAVERRGDAVTFHAVPWRRCLEGLRSGAYDAGLPVVGNKSFLPRYAFPLSGGEIDGGRALGMVNHVVVRRIGSRVEWDGRKFSHLSGPVLYPAGIVVVRDVLAELGVAGDDGSAVEAQTLHKLLARGADAAVIQAASAQELLAREPLRSQLEVLPEPLASRLAYLAFNRAFHDADPAYANAVWRDIATLRASPEWRTLAPALAR